MSSLRTPTIAHVRRPWGALNHRRPEGERCGALIDLMRDVQPDARRFSVDANGRASMLFVIWLLVYLFFVILSLILLLNLLIAMLSFTFEAVREEAVLVCRTAFAQCVIRLELQAVSFKYNVNVGDKKDEIYTYDFRSVINLSDDAGESEGADDPFAIPDGGPLARIESKLTELEGTILPKLQALEALLP